MVGLCSVFMPDWPAPPPCLAFWNVASSPSNFVVVVVVVGTKIKNKITGESVGVLFCWKKTINNNSMEDKSKQTTGEFWKKSINISMEEKSKTDHWRVLEENDKQFNGREIKINHWGVLE